MGSGWFRRSQPPSAPPRVLARCLGVWDLVAFGVGGTVGAGIFVISGTSASIAGPAVGVVLSFTIACIGCALSALCYAEFVTRVPSAGSAYAYVYFAVGEYPAFVTGCVLTFEYALAAATIARSWVSYLGALVSLPSELTEYPWACFSLSPLASLFIILCGCIMIFGAKLTSSVNRLITAWNVCLLLFFIFGGISYVSTANYSPFLPDGFVGVAKASGKVFFAFIGFDSVTTLAEETVAPQRVVPLAIFITLAIALTLYVGCCLVLTGMVPLAALDTHAPLAEAFRFHGSPLAEWVAVGALTTTSACTLCSLVGQPRIFLSLAQDGLLPSFLARVHGEAPRNASVMAIVLAGLLAGTVSFDTLADVISAGTLFVYATVCASLLCVRTEKNALVGVFFVACLAICLATQWHSMCALLLIPLLLFTFPLKNILPIAPFNCPFFPVLPCAGVMVNLMLLASLGWACLLRLAVVISLLTVAYPFARRRERESPRSQGGTKIGRAEDLSDEDRVTGVDMAVSDAPRE